MNSDENKQQIITKDGALLFYLSFFPPLLN